MQVEKGRGVVVEEQQRDTAGIFGFILLIPPRTIGIDGLSLLHFTMPNGAMTTIKDMKTSLENRTLALLW